MKAKILFNYFNATTSRCARKIMKLSIISGILMVSVLFIYSCSSDRKLTYYGDVSRIRDFLLVSMCGNDGLSVGHVDDEVYGNCVSNKIDDNFPIYYKEKYKIKYILSDIIELGGVCYGDSEYFGGDGRALNCYVNYNSYGINYYTGEFFVTNDNMYSWQLTLIEGRGGRVTITSFWRVIL